MVNLIEIKKSLGLFLIINEVVTDDNIIKSIINNRDINASINLYLSLVKDKKLKYKKLGLDYSGSGDSGEVTDIYFYDDIETYVSIDHLLDNVPDIIRLLPDYHNDTTLEIFINYIEYDWYNNDGGSGTLFVDLENLNIHVDGEQYYLESFPIIEKNNLKSLI